MTRTDTAAGLERFSLSGRISLITGATLGLGLEIARGIALGRPVDTSRRAGYLFEVASRCCSHCS